MCVLCACGDNTVPNVPEPWTNGDRFRADVYRYGDVALLAGWYDTLLGLDCTLPQVAGNSCPPFVDVLFADPACTRLLAVTGGGRGQYFQDGFGFYRAVAPYAGPAYSSVDGCHRVADTAGMLVETVPTSLFRSRRITRHQLGDLRYDALDGEDGSQQIVAIDDAVVVVPPLPGRIVPRYASRSVLRAAAAPDLGYDADFELPCHPSHASTGGLRCAVDTIEPATPMRALTHDPTCAPPFTLATVDQSGYVVRETETADGLPALTGQNWHCAVIQPGPWFERQDTCAPIAGPVYGCTSIPDEVFARLELERE
jgi:hypothetical protein